MTTYNPGFEKAYVDALYERVRDAIDRAYYTKDETTEVLRDWTRDACARDRFEALIAKEQQAERAHRTWGSNWAQYHRPVSVRHCARLMVLHNIGEGAARTQPVTAEMFLTMREGAAEALQIGYLARVSLAQHELARQLQALDYAAVVAK
jgi:hypothetical protein